MIDMAWQTLQQPPLALANKTRNSLTLRAVLLIDDPQFPWLGL